ncbi:cytochrome P450, partial [Pleurotus eryngii]
LLYHLEVQTKEQEELNRVIGHNRFPALEDYDSRPYVKCVRQEIPSKKLRAPAIPHRAVDDDIYKRMFIPNPGAIIISNAKGMALDENVYTEPTRFNPDCFLPKGGGNKEPRPVATFGFGRRICPGRHLAAASIWIAVAAVFATVNVDKAKDQDGKRFTPEIMFETGKTRCVE